MSTSHTICVFLMLSLSLISSPASAAEHVLADFEAVASAVRWRNAQAPAPDCRAADIEHSAVHAAGGYGSLRVVFPRHAPGLQPYVVLAATVDNGLLSRADWTAFTVVEFDLLLEGDQPATVVWGVRGAERRRRFRQHLADLNPTQVPCPALGYCKGGTGKGPVSG